MGLEPAGYLAKPYRYQGRLTNNNRVIGSKLAREPVAELALPNINLLQCHHDKIVRMNYWGRKYSRCLPPVMTGMATTFS